jgi:hypothetical protein
MSKLLNETDHEKYTKIVEGVKAWLKKHYGILCEIRDIDEALFADWPEGEEHREWLRTASAEEIVDWAEGVVGHKLLEDYYKQD